MGLIWKNRCYLTSTYCQVGHAPVSILLGQIWAFLYPYMSLSSAVWLKRRWSLGASSEMQQNGRGRKELGLVPGNCTPSYEISSTKLEIQDTFDRPYSCGVTYVLLRTRHSLFWFYCFQFDLSSNPLTFTLSWRRPKCSTMLLKTVTNVTNTLSVSIAVCLNFEDELISSRLGR